MTQISKTTTDEVHEDSWIFRRENFVDPYKSLMPVGKETRALIEMITRIYYGRS